MTTRVRRRVRVACAASAATLLGSVAVACGIPADGSSQRIDKHDVPFELLNPAPTTTTTVDGGSVAPPDSLLPRDLVSLYLVRNDRIERHVREVPQPLGVKDRLLLLGLTLTAEETTQGFRSAVAPASVTGVVTAGGVATVDLTAMFAEMPANEQVLALAQITYTLTDMPGIGQVVFTLNGAPVQVFGGDGMFVAGPVTRETYAQRFATPPSETVRR